MSVRLPARVGPDGSPVLLADQDRSRWDRLLIRRGLDALERAQQLRRPLGPYALQAAVAAGNAYVNVHTNGGVAPPNTGPGDFPGGEIRGQLHPASSDVGGVEKGRGHGRGR